MVVQGDFSRDMRADEQEAVHGLLCATFETDAEAQLVGKLRKTKAMAGEIVLPVDGQIVGYYALSYMAAPKGWLALAPVAIHPDFQRRKLGKRMLGMLSEWSRITQTPIVVLGNPDFYEKAGFDRAKAAHLKTPYPVEFTMLCGVSGAPSEVLRYPKAFDGV